MTTPVREMWMAVIKETKIIGGVEWAFGRVCGGVEDRTLAFNAYRVVLPKDRRGRWKLDRTFSSPVAERAVRAALRKVR